MKLIFGYAALLGAATLAGAWKIGEARKEARHKAEANYPVAKKPMDLDHKKFLESQFPGITSYDLEENGGNGSGALETPEVDKYYTDTTKNVPIQPGEDAYDTKLWDALENVH